MDIASETVTGVVLIVLGVALIRLRRGVSQYMVTWYRKIGVDVPEDKYARQFVFVGVMMMVLGFLVASDLFQHL